MKKTIIFLLFVVIASIGCNRPAKEAPVSVHHEWGKLKEVIIGSGDDFIIPIWSEGMKAPEGNDIVDFFKKHGGKRLDEVDPESAKKIIEQVENLVRVLEERGIKVHRLKHLGPDEESYLAEGKTYLFPRDPILVIDNNIIELSLRAPFRRKERYEIRPIIERFLNDPQVKYISMPPASPYIDETGPFMEGGDVLLNGYEIYVGNSGVATNKEAIEWLQNYLGPKYKVHEIKLKPTFLHLDCAMALLRPGLGLLAPSALAGDLPDSLRNWDFITVTDEEAKKLGANVFVLDEKAVIVDKQFKRIAEEIRKRGLEVIEIPYDEVAKYGGAFRCSHHPLKREST